MNENTPPDRANITNPTLTDLTNENSPPLTAEIRSDSGAGETQLTPPPRVEKSDLGLDTTLGVLEVLSESEQSELETCETVIATGWQTFVEVGLALARIRDGGLYRTEFESFEAYCRAKWQYGRHYVNRLISAAQVFTHLVTICHHRKPEHEGQVRPLIGLSPEQAQLAWQCAIEEAGDQKITARLVKTAVQQLGLARTPATVNRPPRQNKAEQRRLINNAVGQLLMLLSQKASHEILTEKVEALHRLIQPLLASPVAPR